MKTRASIILVQIVLIIAFIILFSVVKANIDNEYAASKMADLAGTWEGKEAAPEEVPQALLEGLELTDAEIEVAHQIPLYAVVQATFRSDGTFQFGCNNTKTKEEFRHYFQEVFMALYEHSDELYGDMFTDCSYESFVLIYALFHGYESIDAFIDSILEMIPISDLFPECAATGTYTIKKDSGIILEVDGKTEKSRLPYSISGNTLTLRYSEGSVEYTRIYSQYRQ